MDIDFNRMYREAGTRENYAIDKFFEGTAVIRIAKGYPDCIRFEFDDDKKSGSNGATWSVRERRWVN